MDEIVDLKEEIIRRIESYIYEEYNIEMDEFEKKEHIHTLYKKLYRKYKNKKFVVGSNEYITMNMDITLYCIGHIGGYYEKE